MGAGCLAPILFLGEPYLGWLGTVAGQEETLQLLETTLLPVSRH